jgi:hypothetical protein
MPEVDTDVIDMLVVIKPGSAPEIPGGITATERFAAAAFVIGLHGDAATASFYAPRLVNGEYLCSTRVICSSPGSIRAGNQPQGCRGHMAYFLAGGRLAWAGSAVRNGESAMAAMRRATALLRSKTTPKATAHASVATPIATGSSGKILLKASSSGKCVRYRLKVTEAAAAIAPRYRPNAPSSASRAARIASATRLANR